MMPKKYTYKYKEKIISKYTNKLVSNNLAK